MLSERSQALMDQLLVSLAKEQVAIWGFLMKNGGEGSVFSSPALSREDLTECTQIALGNLAEQKNVEAYERPKSQIIYQA